MKHGVSTDLAGAGASLRDERSPKAVIFDFDGVILESSNIKTEACLELFEDYPEHRAAIHYRPVMLGTHILRFETAAIAAAAVASAARSRSAHG